jgi:elongation of very long chain fatty acids protein 7
MTKCDNLYYYMLSISIADPRVADWPMMSSPVPTLALCLFYAYFSRTLAPRLMEDRKPMDLRKLLIFYNLFQTIFSSWIFYEVSHLYIYVCSSMFCLMFTRITT